MEELNLVVNNKKENELEEQLKTNPDYQIETYGHILNNVHSVGKIQQEKLEQCKKMSNIISKINNTLMESPEKQDELMKEIEELYNKHLNGEEILKEQGFTEKIVNRFEENELNELKEKYDINKQLNKEELIAFIAYLIDTKDVEKLLENSKVEIENINNKFMNDINDLLTELDTFKLLADLQEELDKTDLQDERRTEIENKIKELYALNDLTIIKNKIKNKGIKQIQKELKDLKTVVKKAIKILKNDTEHVYPPERVILSLLRSLYTITNDLEKSRIVTYIYFKNINKRHLERDLTFNIFFPMYVAKCCVHSEEERKESFFYNKLMEIYDSIKL